MWNSCMGTSGTTRVLMINCARVAYPDMRIAWIPAKSASQAEPSRLYKLIVCIVLTCEPAHTYVYIHVWLFPGWCGSQTQTHRSFITEILILLSASRSPDPPFPPKSCASPDDHAMMTAVRLKCPHTMQRNTISPLWKHSARKAVTAFAQSQCRAMRQPDTHRTKRHTIHVTSVLVRFHASSRQQKKSERMRTCKMRICAKLRQTPPTSVSLCEHNRSLNAGQPKTGNHVDDDDIIIVCARSANYDDDDEDVGAIFYDYTILISKYQVRPGPGLRFNGPNIRFDGSKEIPSVCQSATQTRDVI